MEKEVRIKKTDFDKARKAIKELTFELFHHTNAFESSPQTKELLKSINDILTNDSY